MKTSEPISVPSKHFFERVGHADLVGCKLGWTWMQIWLDASLVGCRSGWMQIWLDADLVGHGCRSGWMDASGLIFTVYRCACIISKSLELNFDTFASIIISKKRTLNKVVRKRERERERGNVFVCVCV